MKFKDLRENLTSRMVSMAVKHTTPKKKPLVKEGRADDAFDELDRERFRPKVRPETKSTYMDNDGGAVAPKNITNNDYMDKGPASSTGSTSKSYIDKNPAVSPTTPSSSGKTMKFKDLPELDKEQWRRDRKAAGMPPMQEDAPQIGDGIYLELGDSLIETEIVDETEDGYIIYIDEEGESMMSKVPDLVFGKDTMASLRKISQFNKDKEDPQKKSSAAADFWNKQLSKTPSKNVNEAEYQGRDVPLNKPMSGDVAKSKVYVKGPSGRVVKVNFGDKNMTIKKNIPARRKSFRARHRCETPGPKHKARYWSCKAW